MITSLAQSVALVAHGNAFLAGTTAVPDLDAANSAFQSTAILRFVFSAKASSSPTVLGSMLGSRSAHGSVQEIAVRTADWFRYLKSAGVRRLTLVSLEQANTAIPLYVATAFAGFTHWVILAESASAATWWSGTEERIVPEEAGQRALPAQAGSEERIWQVTYTGTPAQPGPPVVPDLGSARDSLRRILGEAIQFADAARADHWRDYLTWALEQLDSSTPQARYFWDMLPDSGYPIEAHQLLATASSAWVFGGAGYWNDMPVHASLTSRYERITPALYAAIMNAIVAATNAFDPALL